ncbi:MAG: GPW/gp25 family protein [Solirubrobacteraceae bacterium]
MNVAFPYHLDRRGQTATASDDDHIRHMLEQLLFTSPGERVNRPDFGCGLRDLVFGPNSPEVAAALQVTIGSAIQRWLGDLIAVTSLAVTAHESELDVELGYQIRATGQAGQAAVSLPGNI